MAHIIPIAIREWEKGWEEIKPLLPNKVVAQVEEIMDFSLILDASSKMIFTNQVLKEKLAEIMSKNVFTNEKVKNKKIEIDFKKELKEEGPKEKGK